MLYVKDDHMCEGGRFSVGVLVCWCVGVDVCMYAYIYVLCKPIDLCDSYRGKETKEKKKGSSNNQYKPT